MLPGFRFLLAAIVLSMSVLVFGLGAAALLRAAHEEFASSPTWRVAPEPKFAQQNEAPEGAPEKRRCLCWRCCASNQSRSSRRPRTAFRRLRRQPSNRRIAPVPDQAEKIAALEPQDKTPPEAAKPEIPVADTPVQGEAQTAEAPAPAEETRIATAEPVLPAANEAIAAAPEPAIAPPAVTTDLIATKIATLGGPPVSIETPSPPPAKAADKTRPERRQETLAGAACHRAAQGSRCARDRRLNNRPPIRSRSRPSPPAAAKL